MEWVNEELKYLKRKGLLRKPAALSSPQSTRITVNGRTFINFSSNDYLNLSGHAAIVHAAVRALQKYGFGAGSSRLLSGTLAPHRQLEQRISDFKKTQAALVFNTGYGANTGIIPALTDSNTIILSDELNHASIVDGTRLSRADVSVFRHRDMEHLESLLKKYRKGRKYMRSFIVSDTVFSMDGDIAPLQALASLAIRYDALLMIDDAHAFGVIGETGRGGLEYGGVSHDEIIQMGTLSKAAGCFGAYVAGKREVMDILVSRARSFMYSTALPPAAAAAAMKALDIIDRRSAGLRKRLWKNRERFYRGLVKLGYDTLGSETPIIPVLAGDVASAMRMGRYLYGSGIFAPAIRPPTVADGRCRIRFSVTAGHTYDEIDMVLDSLRRMK